MVYKVGVHMPASRFHRMLRQARALTLLLAIAATASCRHSQNAQIFPPPSLNAADLVVAQDGTGDFRTIQAALDTIAPDNASWRYVLVKNGTYGEKLYIKSSHVAIVGENRDLTRIVFAELRKNWRKSHPDDWGAAVVNIGDNVSDVVLANLTVHNNYGALHGDNDHQFAIRSGGHSTRISLLHAAIIADGGDTLSLWNADAGMYYHNDCYFEGYVDFVCPRGKNYISNSSFYAQPSPAAIWHDGSRDRSHKFVIRHSWFEGVPGFPLGRNHRDGQFFLLDNALSSNMADKPIYQPQAPQPVLWGERYYYWNSHRDGGDFAWFADNLDKAEGAPAAAMIDAKWTFAGQWNPENTLPPVLPFANIPRPENTSTAISVDNVELRWLPARNSIRQRVYFGTTKSPSLRKEQRQSAFQPGRLRPATAYYWRVDSVTRSGVVTGPLWTFTTAGVTAAPASPHASLFTQKPRIVLVGDSTVTDEIGWGRGFKSYFANTAECINHARNGRSSKSYFNEGLWLKALADKPDYVLIQFGHNDMRGKGPDRETDPHGKYLEYLSRYIAEARAAGTVPVIVTPISRRRYDASGELDDDLWEYAQAARQLAVEQHVALIDLHELSVRMLRTMGTQSREKFGSNKPDGTTDNTHLNDEASKLFGTLVAAELTKVIPALSSLRR